jgi:hypothetical protein
MRYEKRSAAARCGWFMALLLSAALAGCGGGGDSAGGTTGPGGSAVPGVPAVPGTAGTPGAAATNPTVGSASPANNATGVATSANSTANVLSGTQLSATFTEAMDPATVTAAGVFTLKQTVAGTNVPGTVTMSAGNTVATFSPTAAALLPNTSYTATITTAAKNAAGTAMPSPVVWSFTTNATAKVTQAPVNLLSILTNNFVVLTKTGITNTGSHASVITGNIGASPITAAAMDNVFCTEITGTIYGVDAAYTGSGATTCFAGNPPAANKTLVDNAVADMVTAYNEAAGRTGPDFVDLFAGNISGKTLAPGLYKWSTGVTIASDVTLSGGADDVWIFQIAGDITQSSATAVLLAGGAKAKNIFWQVGGPTGVAINTTGKFEGTILAQKAITLNTGTVANSRMLSQTAVTLDATRITRPAP